MKFFIIFHGTHGSPEVNWFSWLKRALEERGYSTFVPTLPTPDGQSVDGWMAAAREQIPSFSSDDEITLIGHSCGATFLLHYLEQTNIEAKQCIFVSPVMKKIDIQEYDELNSSFIDHEFDWNVIKSRAGNTNVLHGDNDPYVPIEQAHELSAALGIQTTVIKGGGHLNTESGYTHFPNILHQIENLT